MNPRPDPSRPTPPSAAARFRAARGRMAVFFAGLCVLPAFVGCTPFDMANQAAGTAAAAAGTAVAATSEATSRTAEYAATLPSRAAAIDKRVNDATNRLISESLEGADATRFALLDARDDFLRGEGIDLSETRAQAARTLTGGLASLGGEAGGLLGVNPNAGPSMRLGVGAANRLGGTNGLGGLAGGSPYSASATSTASGAPTAAALPDGWPTEGVFGAIREAMASREEGPSKSLGASGKDGSGTAGRLYGGKDGQGAGTAKDLVSVDAKGLYADASKGLGKASSSPYGGKTGAPAGRWDDSEASAKDPSLLDILTAPAEKPGTGGRLPSYLPTDAQKNDGDTGGPSLTDILTRTMK